MSILFTQARFLQVSMDLLTKKSELVKSIPTTDIFPSKTIYLIFSCTYIILKIIDELLTKKGSEMSYKLIIIN